MNLRSLLSPRVMAFSLPVLIVGCGRSESTLPNTSNLASIQIRELSTQGYDRYEFAMTSVDGQGTSVAKKSQPKGSGDIKLAVKPGEYLVTLDYFSSQGKVYSADFCNESVRNNKILLVAGQNFKKIKVCNKAEQPLDAELTIEPVLENGVDLSPSSINAGSQASQESELYLNPSDQLQAAVKQYESTDPEAARLLRYIDSQPTATWLGGWTPNVEQATREVMAKAQGKIATFVTYNISDRDCGQHSAGGVGTLDLYKAFIDQISRGIGNGKALVVIEPDGLTLQDCLVAAPEKLKLRIDSLNYAVRKLKSNPQTKVYIDAGHSAWLSAEEVASRLKQVSIEIADGFALNTSNYRTTDSNVEFGRRVVQLLGMKKGFIIDTSRNGNGPYGTEWCNPPGRALGEKPSMNPNIDGVDALLWIKRPGESDGYCGGGPDAGKFWPEYAIDLARRAQI